MNVVVNERETEADNSAENPSGEIRSDIAVNATLRDPEFWLFRHIPLRRMVPLALLAAVAAWVALALDAPIAAVAGIGAAVLLLGAVPVRRADPRNLAGMVATAVAWRWRRARPGPADGGAEPFDVTLPEGGSYGVRWDNDLLVTMLRIDPPPDAMTLLRRGSLSTDQVLPLTEIGKCLSQFDITLTSIDVISTGARTAGNGVVAQLYDRILGPLPAIAHRTVWLVLRLDPLANAEAVDNRGGGRTGSLRTAIIATRRVANRLAAHDISVSVLTAGEMNAAVRRMCWGVPLDQFTETQNSLVHGELRLTSYEIGPELVGSRLRRYLGHAEPQHDGDGAAASGRAASRRRHAGRLPADHPRCAGALRHPHRARRAARHGTAAVARQAVSRLTRHPARADGGARQCRGLSRPAQRTHRHRGAHRWLRAAHRRRSSWPGHRGPADR
ncbi:type VII secretion protein EccE [Nocardia cyriacigeorgica]|uniref:type VII secretion protein EccE n=1 Tax=Nocardia cyriacigeorgica TaxID=135487 RepID=UPI002B4B05DC|nr:type VII secretion protein EccE [Nocardia cyriacigeorgica]